MRRLPWRLSLLLLAVVAPLSTAATLPVADGSHIVLSGTTNVGSWTCNGDRVEGELRVDATTAEIEEWLSRLQTLPYGPVTLETIGTLPVPRFSFVIPIETLACGNRAMERDLRNALRHHEHPEIVFRLVDLHSATSRRESNQRVYTVDLVGELSLAGVTRRKSMTLDVRRANSGRIVATGALDLSMTEFSVNPPVALLGLVRARDDLSASFFLVLAE